MTLMRAISSAFHISRGLKQFDGRRLLTTSFGLHDLCILTGMSTRER